MARALASSLPESLQEQFAAFAARLRRLDLVLSCGAGAVALLAGLLCLFLLDRLWDTPPILRAFLLSVPVIVWGAGFWYYGRRWIWGEMSLERLSRLVQKRYRTLGDRLLGVVELADPSRRPPHVSEALCQAAIRQVAADAEKMDFRQAASRKRPMLVAKVLGAIASVTLVLLLVSPEAMRNAFLRLVRPAKGIDRYTFVRFEDLPSRLVVAKGENFELEFGVVPASWFQPARVSWRWNDGESVSAHVSNRRARLEIPAVHENGLLRISAGDLRRDVAIEPVVRPELQEVWLEVRLPEYLEQPVVNVRATSASVTLLEGSTLQLKATASRRLQSSMVRMNGETITNTIDGARIVSTDIPVQDEAELFVSWTDHYGLNPAHPAAIKIRTIPDAPPFVQLPDLPGAVAILEDEVLILRPASEDDYGIRDMGVSWDVFGPAGEPIPVSDEANIAGGAPDRKKLEGQFAFSPKLAGIPAGSVAEVYASARDYAPERSAAVSGTHRIHILTQAAHAELIRERLESLLLRSEELTRMQEAVMDRGLSLRGDQKRMNSREGAADLKSQQKDQEEIAREAEDVARKAGDLMREALKNQGIDPERIAEMMKTFEMLADLSAEAMPQAAKSLGSSAEASSQNRAPSLDKALEQEQKILEQLRKMAKVGSEGLDRMEMDGFVARLQRISQSYKESAGKMEKLIPEWAGLEVDAIPKAAQEKLSWLSAELADSRRKAIAVHDDLRRFSARLSMKAHSEVAEEMEEARLSQTLSQVEEYVSTNVIGRGWEHSEKWAGQFADWAARLKPKDQPPGGGGGEGQSPKSGAEALMRLMRVREQQIAARAQTEMLERRKDFHPGYKPESFRIAETERKLTKELETLSQGQSPFDPALLRNAGEAMNDAAGLLDQPQTGAMVTDAQTDAINIINYILESAQNQQSSAGGMPMRMAMLMGMSASAGGNQGAFPGGGRGSAAGASSAGTSGGEDATDKASGLDALPIPSEYRDALESYFSGQEKLRSSQP